MVHPRDFVNSRWNSKGAPLGHPWGSVNSRWDPNGAPLGFFEFSIGPQRCTLGDL